MTAYRSDDPPTGPLSVAVASTFPPYTDFIWGGYTAGTWYTQSNTYVAVKGVYYLPTNTGCSSTNHLAWWIGLGGTNMTYPNDLVQQGIECENPNIAMDNLWRPWTEFAAINPAVPFCGYSSWTFASGHKIYQNMSYQTSSNTAYFYLQDENTGVAHSCPGPKPSNWGPFDGNTAEWVGEAGATVYNFGTVNFSDAMTERGSNSAWYSLGSQPVTEVIDGQGMVGGHLYQCIVPGSISGGTAFPDNYYQSQCQYPGS